MWIKVRPIDISCRAGAYFVLVYCQKMLVGIASSDEPDRSSFLVEPGACDKLERLVLPACPCLVCRNSHSLQHERKLEWHIKAATLAFAGAMSAADPRQPMVPVMPSSFEADYAFLTDNAERSVETKSLRDCCVISR